MRKKQLIGFITVIFLGYCSLFLLKKPLSTQSIKQLIQKIPYEDRIFLESFLDYLITFEDGNYVLFGSKPSALMCYKNWNAETSLITFQGVSSSIFCPIKKGFEIWQKYKHLFPLKKYAILKMNFFSGFTAILLIHKKRLFTILQDNFDEFKKAFPELKSVNHLWSWMNEDPDSLKKISFNHEQLLGMILGFGKDNAKLYQRKWEINDFLFPQSVFVKRHYIKPPLTLLPEKGFSSLEEEAALIETKWKGLLGPDDARALSVLTFHNPIGFLVDQTKCNLEELKAKYKKEHITSTLKYINGNFLEVTLQELVSEN